MKSLSKAIISLILIISMLLGVVSCADVNVNQNSGNEVGGNQGSDNENNPSTDFYIIGDSRYVLAIGDSITLSLNIPEDAEGEVTWESSHSCVAVEGGVITVLSGGTAVVKATLGDFSDRVIIIVPLDLSGGDNTTDEDDTSVGGEDNTDEGDDNIGGDDNTGEGDDTIGGDDNTDEGDDTIGGEDNTGDGDDSNGGNGSSDDSSDSAGGDNTDNGNGDEADGGENDEEFGTGYKTITVAEALTLAAQYSSSSSTDKFYVIGTIDDIESASDGRMYIYDETGFIYVYKSKISSDLGISITTLHEGNVVLLYGTLRNYKGTLEIDYATVIAVKGYYVPPAEDDPYQNVDEDEFYANYKPASSYEESYFRTQNNLMSGTIGDQDQAPTISKYQPKQNGKYVRNSEMLYSEDGNTYYVVNAYGDIVMEIYRGGAYIMLEEVAAYVFAFGEPPANQVSSKNTKPTSSPWGKYLRLNHSAFSGSTKSYPYEPELPNISGCGGTLNYYEMDIGTTGTTCDPSYTAAVYNNGSTITRGAARIVYVCEDDDGNGTIDYDERYVFYTYNHYNDFQEYLNYEGGWGEMFGNITGGGTISSKNDYNPTPYVNTVIAKITNEVTVTVICYADVKKYLLSL